jgi:hypothetical protein
LSKLFCKFLAPWKGRVLFVCPELALTHFAMKTSISVAVRESRDGIGVVKLPIGYAKASVFAGVAFLRLQRSNLPKLCCQRQKFCLYTIIGKRIGANLVSEI